MRMPEPLPYSYRADPAVPAFDDAKGLFVFDGACVLCSTGVRWLMAIDRGRRFNVTTTERPLGAALFRHYGQDPDGTYLLVADGRSWTLSDGYIELARRLGGGWRLFTVARLVPRAWRDAAYRWLATNRYRLFGTTGQCALLTPEQRAMLL